MRKYINLLNRDLNGILLLDKPSGFSSNYFLNKIKKLYCSNNKVGYAGTLDPIATGMLPICFGKATKLSKYLLNSDKRYTVFAKLGESTNTFDSNGIITRVLPVKYCKKKLEQCLQSFQGKSYQVPPMFSSIKHNGIPLYKYARKGMEIPRKTRIIYIYDINIINKIANVIGLNIHCSKGTYIRSIIHDIGKNLGCGAHVTGLRRLNVGQYDSSLMVNIKTIESIVYNFNLNDLEVLEKLNALLISTEKK